MINTFNPLALFMFLKYKLSTMTKNIFVFFLKAYIYLMFQYLMFPLAYFGLIGEALIWEAMLIKQTV